MTATIEAPATVRVLDARAYDTLRNMADANGGVGYGLLHEEGCRDHPPLDSWGLLEVGLGGEVYEALRYLKAAGLAGIEEENAIRRIIKRLGIPDGPYDPYPRVPFFAWCDELHVKRGKPE